MATDLLGSAFASFLGHRRVACNPTSNEQQIDLNQTNVQSFSEQASPQIPTPTPTTINPLVNFPSLCSDETFPPPLKRLRYASSSDTATVHVNTNHYDQLPTVLSPNSILPPPSLLQQLDNSLVSYTTPSSSNDTTIQQRPYPSPFEKVHPATNNASPSHKRKISYSTIFSPPLIVSTLLDSDSYPNGGSLLTGPSNSISCSQCDKTFSNEEDLKAHQKAHVRPFSCRVQGCKASFSKANHLSRHIRIVHNKERPFGCTVPGCSSRFGSKSHLGDHTRAVHMRLRTFKCDICNASWSKRFNLQKHIRIRHLGEKPYRCATCNMSFGTLSHVTRHEATVHKKDAT